MCKYLGFEESQHGCAIVMQKANGTVADCLKPNKDDYGRFYCFCFCFCFCCEFSREEQHYELVNMVGRITNYLIMMLRALKLFHDQKFVHCDVKPVT